MRNLLLKTLAIVPALIIGLALPIGAAVRSPSATDEPTGSADPQALASNAMTRAALQACGELRNAALIAAPGDCEVMGYQREIITDKIAHYKFKVRFGPGPYDVMQMHRIVRENKPFNPSRAQDGILLMHGDVLGIEGAWLANLKSPGMPVDHSLAVFLAKNGIDVWGVDMGWTLVPVEETDFSFMKDWGYAKDLQQMDLALAIARAGRAATGSGGDRIFTLGWSQGAGKLFAYASAETQVPPGRRHVRGYIPVDMAVMFTDETKRQACCADYYWYRGRLDAGDYVETIGSLFILLGQLARTDPSGDSPVYPGLSNYTAALTFGAVPFGYVYYPNYHLVAGTFGGDGTATGLQYSSIPYYFDWLQGAAPYEALQVEADINGVCCPEIDAPWDDHFGEVTTPILFVLAGGGLLDPGYQTIPFFTSAELTPLFIQLHPSEEAALDFAHVDLFIADNAPDLVWRPILNWMKAH